MNPRRLHKLTIFSIRCASGLALIRMKHPQISQIYADYFWPRPFSSGFSICENLRNLRTVFCPLFLDCYLGFDRVGDETILVRGVMHLVELFRGWFLFARECDFRF